MSTLIAYITKRGTTEYCAKQLAEKVEGPVELLDVRKNPVGADWSAYDTVILGVPIYGGDIEREFKQFVRENWRFILSKRCLGLYICGLFDGEKGLAEIKKAYPEQLTKKALVADNFGGRVVQSELGFIERTAFRMVTKIKEDYSNLSEEKINAFAARINEARTAPPQKASVSK
ncbi:flavodoxin domain-containing protein [Heliobacterium mobile]|uniref:flavodoxin domain-containing protein n=1 Tax=Heliobacterium mobile TaxID=28064 RepID=UPI0014796B46|nr:flavodoxin domain-containing protein [Heliobacterium mobile]